MKKSQSKIFSTVALSFFILSNLSCTYNDSINEMRKSKPNTELKNKKAESNLELENEKHTSPIEENSKTESKKKEKPGFFAFLWKPYFGLCQPEEGDIEKEFEVNKNGIPNYEKTLDNLNENNEGYYIESDKGENSEDITESKKKDFIRRSETKENFIKDETSENIEEEGEEKREEGLNIIPCIFPFEESYEAQNDKNEFTIKKADSNSTDENSPTQKEPSKKTKNSVEKTKTYSIRRDPFDINPYNISRKIKKTIQIIKIKNIRMQTFSEYNFEEVRANLSEIQKPILNQEIINPQKKKKNKTTLSPIIERSSENNNPDTVKSNYYGTTLEKLDEENSNESYSIEQSKRTMIKEKNLSTEKNSLYVLRDNITEDVVDYSMKRDEEYFLLYNLILPKKIDKIEYPYSLPTVKELLQIFTDSIKVNNQNFFNKIFLTQTQVTIPSQKGENDSEVYVTILFSPTTTQFFFELIKQKDIKQAVHDKRIYRIAVQKIGENPKESVCCHYFSSPLFCCNNKCIKPKYLCHCCYCPSSVTCCNEEMELYNCGISNFFCCYLPAISGCCVHKFDNLESEEEPNIDY